MGAAPGMAPAPEMPKFLKGPSKLGLGIQLAGAAVTAAAPMFKAKPPGFQPQTPTPGINVDAVQQYMPIPQVYYPRSCLDITNDLFTRNSRIVINSYNQQYKIVNGIVSMQTIK